MKYYPMFVDLRGRECAVIGGGEVAARKIEALLKAGAKVTVISPELSEAVGQLEREGGLRVIRRRYERGDIERFFLAFAAAGDPQVEAEIAAEARSAGVLLNVVDRPGLCDFITPSMIERGELTIAISTGGKSPGLARKVRQEIEKIIGPEYASCLEIVAKVRQGLKEFPLTDSERREILGRLLDSPLIDLVREGSVEAADAIVKEVTGETRLADEKRGVPSSKAAGNFE
jgi:precorrin-2 dehydrogenase / sirohydrochlorin ferrochelatase